MSTHEQDYAFGEPFIVQGEIHRATVVPTGDQEAMIRVVPPFTPGKGILSDISSHKLTHDLTIPGKATILEISTRGDGELDLADLKHAVGSLVVELDAAKAGTSYWAVPESTPVYSPSEATGGAPL